MTVADFIEWLKTQDQGAVVLCLEHDSAGSYCEQGGTCSVIEFTPDSSGYTDFRGNQFVPNNSDYYNKRYLLIGLGS